ncbi:Ig-like domain-containing protein, partial [Candidatus Kaiserbacteria bacterium]|nr:Ig-like domain-containing protein [Candidatus Kaiserbacteria bacterium]
TDNATDVAVDTAITITFNANIAFGTGNITLRDNDGGWADLEAFDVTTDTGGGAGTVSISGAVLTIEPTTDLANSIEYAIRIDATAIDTTDGVSFAGIADDTSISFTTVAAATAPAAFTSGQWTSATGSGASEIDIGITTLPSDGGSAITALQYSVDNGSTWTNLTGTGTGSRTIDQHSDSTTGTLTADTSYNVKVRAVNAVNPGADSDTKATTTGAAATSLADQLIAATGSKIKILYDFTDFANMKQDTGGSTAVTATDDPVRYWADMSGNGNHATASATNTPGNAIAKSGYLDLNDAAFRLITISGITSGMEVYALLDRGADIAWVLLGKNNSNSHSAGTVATGDGNATFGGFSGTVSDYVDNTIVSPQTRGQLYDRVVSTSGYRIQSFRGIDLTGESNLLFMAFNTVGYRFSGGVKCFFICEGLTSGEQSSVDAIMDGYK